jgi:hypothetical protein
MEARFHWSRYWDSILEAKLRDDAIDECGLGKSNSVICSVAFESNSETETSLAKVGYSPFSA